MQVLVITALLLTVYVFNIVHCGSIEARLNVTSKSNLSCLTPDINDMAKDQRPVLTKKFVPSLFAKSNWYLALRYCRLHGMDLASIESQEEEKQLVPKLEKIGLSNEHFLIWTSGNDLANEGDYFWMTSGKPIIYKNWGNGLPRGGTDYNCIALRHLANGSVYWDDLSCSNKFHFVCEHYGTNDAWLTMEKII